MTRSVAAAVLLVLASVATTGCTTRERTGTVAGPGFTVAPKSSVRDTAAIAPGGDAGAHPSDDTGSDHVSPVTATFETLTAAGARVDFRACEQRVVAVTKGSAAITWEKGGAEKLAVGDVFLAQGKGGFDVKGDGLAVFASVRTHVCEPVTTPGIYPTVIRAGAAAELTWGTPQATMHAKLDSDGNAASLAYIGRLYGNASVAEHRHEGSWEILAAIDGAGTCTLDGKASRLGPGQIKVIPPGVAHSWTPDPGTSLSAVQMYAPAGPEQRFKALSAAGTKKSPTP